MADVASSGYTVGDLHWLRNAIGVAHLELDPWGSVVASPVDDDHEITRGKLLRQAGGQLDADHPVLASFAWVVPGGTGYLMVPDMMVLAPGWRRVDELHIDPPPLLVVEIASPSTRRVDRSRKLADYRLGGAEKYLLVDLPAVFELHDFTAGTVVTSTGSIELDVAGRHVRFDLP